MKKLGFIYAGQGSQAVGMGKSLYDTQPAAKQVLGCGRPGF